MRNFRVLGLCAGFLLAACGNATDLSEQPQTNLPINGETPVGDDDGTNAPVDPGSTGAPSMPYLRTVHEDGIAVHEALCGECARRGLFMTSHHNLFVSAAHTDEIVERTLAIFDDACGAVSKEC